MNTKYKELAIEKKLIFTDFAILYLICEFLLIFILLPFVAYWQRDYVKLYVIPSIVTISLLSLILLLLDSEFNRSQLWNAESLWCGCKRILVAFLPGSILVTIIMPIFFPELFLILLKQDFQIWLLLIIIYPIFSVYPQEIVYRCFIFHRYRKVFNSKWSMILASSVGFSLAHLFFGNWIAPAATFLAGILFGYTYHHSKSCLQASIEHSLWGNFAFTIGLGWFFFSGAIT